MYSCTGSKSVALKSPRSGLIKIPFSPNCVESDFDRKRNTVILESSCSSISSGYALYTFDEVLLPTITSGLNSCCITSTGKLLYNPPSNTYLPSTCMGRKQTGTETVTRNDSLKLTAPRPLALGEKI